MQGGLAKHREIGAVVLAPAFMAVMAELYQKLGRPAEALSTVTEALRWRSSPDSTTGSRSCTG